ncbi:hypothetical protein [Williamsia sterculiae]|uniref:Proteins of 100 residues with WXG n=1 Tax=Williamsia sterculiae TaxID=1344003 RepID=A0A1N7DU35_9NOCA|nr:hypothetical protein [Williamsia sterculiae]SIR79356.1 hypothetical protein SAMN05445060_0908 [Williamsia sterculiae]
MNPTELAALRVVAEAGVQFLVDVTPAARQAGIAGFDDAHRFRAQFDATESIDIAGLHADSEVVADAERVLRDLDPDDDQISQGWSGRAGDAMGAAVSGHLRQVAAVLTALRDSGAALGVIGDSLTAVLAAKYRAVGAVAGALPTAESLSTAYGALDLTSRVTLFDQATATAHAAVDQMFGALTTSLSAVDSDSATAFGAGSDPGDPSSHPSGTQAPMPESPMPESQSPHVSAPESPEPEPPVAQPQPPTAEFPADPESTAPQPAPVVPDAAADSPAQPDGTHADGSHREVDVPLRLGATSGTGDGVRLALLGDE